MSYEDSEQQKTFLSKLKDNYTAKFGNFALTTTIQKVSNYVDKDGKSETDTLIHNSFVKYFDSKNEPYPEWLGVPNRNPTRDSSRQSTSSQSQTYQNSQYQPVYSSYNTPQPQPQQPQSQSSGSTSFDPRNNGQGYKPRSSRLQDMHNKSRQQHIPASGYNTNTQSTARSNSRTSGNRLRERMMNSNSMTGMSNILNDNGTPQSGSSGQSGPRGATWGR